MGRPRVLLITRNLPPLVGGMERLNWHMAEELAKAAEVRIIGPAGSAALAPSGIEIREAPLSPLWRFLLTARHLARCEARRWKPDIVLAGSGLTAPLARAAARTCGARTAAYVHGLDVVVRHPVYRAIWLPAIRRMDRVIANSRATADLCHRVGVKAGRTGIVHPGVDLPQMPCRSDPGLRQPQDDSEPPSQPRGVPTKKRGADGQPGDFRQRHQLGSRPLLLCVGRLSARKGLREFVTRALPRIVAARSDVMLLVVGSAPHQALHAKAQTPESIQSAASAAGVGEHVQFLGKVSDDELRAGWESVDAHIFPVRHIPGDPEGFGMVAVEAAAHGVPTVAFATGGVVDAVADGTSGVLVPSGDYAAFADAVVRMLTAPELTASGCRAFARRFAWPEFGESIREQLDTLVSNSSTTQRQPHAVLDLPSRRWKGMKIERLLTLAERQQPLRLLEIGTGSGGIAHYFAMHSKLRCGVDAVDVCDNRQVRDGYRFQLVQGTQLPFADASFDVVLTNHVIEHVGDTNAQQRHLAEVRRVMRHDGVGYLAVPNRWMLTEPHYKLKFLSWWPHAWRTPYLRLMRKGTFYDCEPLQMRQLEHMLHAAGFTHRNLCIEAWRETFEIERPTSLGTRMLRATPDALLAPLKRIIPTLIYRIEPAER